MPIWFLIGLAVPAVLACGEAFSANPDPLSLPGDGSPGLSPEPPSSSELLSMPEDLMTSVNTTAPTILVLRSAVDEAELARLISRVSIVTWPERTVLTTEAELIDDQSLSAGAPPEHSASS